MKTVTFYTKPDCSLCDKAERVLRQVRAELPFEWVTVDITQDEAAFRRYCVDIPVVCIDGVEAFKHALEPEALRRALAAP